MFPIMDMVQRNSLALQEMTMEKTMTSERVAKADCGLGLAADGLSLGDDEGALDTDGLLDGACDGFVEMLGPSDG